MDRPAFVSRGTMDPELEAFDKEWRAGDRDVARELAQAWVDNHRDTLVALLGGYAREGLVQLVSAYRDAGMDEDRIAVDAWLLCEFTKQRVVGVASFGLTELLKVSPMATIRDEQRMAVLGQKVG